MTHSHSHPHRHDHRHAHDPAGAGRALSGALGVTLAFAFVEAVVGLGAGSLALLSDAAHMLVDSGALALALFAQRLAARPRTASHTFGFRRAEVIAAAISGGALGAASLGIIIEAAGRLSAPHPVRGEWMLATAVLGLVVNAASGAVLLRSAHASINVRAALAHVAADAAGSVAAIAAAVAVLRFDLPQADAVASILISVLILWGAARLIRESAGILMEQAPSGLPAEAIEATVRATKGVADLHDLHVWTISDGFPVVTVHVVLEGGAHGAEVAGEVARRVAREHGVTHVTVQPEARVVAEAPIAFAPRRAHGS